MLQNKFMCLGVQKQQIMSFNMQSLTRKGDTVVNQNSCYPRLLIFIYNTGNDYLYNIWKFISSIIIQ